MAFGFGFGMPRIFSVARFSPLSLFSGGAPGAWYDPSDYSTLFQDSAGTTPITAVEQPVGLMLDKSQGLVLGSELVVNGDLSNGITNWTASSSSIANVSGELQVTNSGAVFGLGYQAITVTPNKWHKISITFRAGTASIVYAQVKESVPSGASVFNQNTASKTNVTITGYFYATLSTYYVSCVNNNESNATGFFDNISVKELAGNHAFQSTSASRPVLSARYNLLTKTEQFDDAVWSKAAGVTVTANTDIAPNGTMTADTVTSGANQIDQSITVSQSTLYTDSLYFKKTSGAAYQPGMYLLFSGGTLVIYAVRLNTDTGVATAVSAGGFTAPSSFSVTEDGNYWKLSITGNSNNNTTGVLRLYPNLNAAGGSGAGSQVIWGASLVPANQSTLPYQRVNTATDYATTGFLPYLKFDGVDDSLSTNSISFTSTDKMSVFAGVRKLDTSANNNMIVELSSDMGAATGVFNLYASNDRFRYGLKQSAAAVYDATTYNSPITVATSVIYDIAGAAIAQEVFPRINGAVPTLTVAAAGPAGTGNFGNYPLYIGRRGGTTLPFNGQMYSMIIVGKAVTSGELSSTETYVNQKTGAY